MPTVALSELSLPKVVVETIRAIAVRKLDMLRRKGIIMHESGNFTTTTKTVLRITRNKLFSHYQLGILKT